MQLTSFTDYSLRVLVFAAAHDDRRCQTAEVATTFGISRHHVVKVVNALAHLGYLETVRGRDGGFALARPATEIGLGEVVRRTEGSMSVVECFAPATNTCPLLPACGLSQVLGDALTAFLRVLDRHTLADLLAEPRWRARVRGLPRTRAGRRPATTTRRPALRPRP